jgi:hypothetical protein
MSTVYLFSFFIQKYLYNLKNENDFNKTYVPDIENIYYHFTQKEMRKSITKMNLARRNNRFQYSINFQQFLIKPINKDDNKYFFEINYFYEFFIEIVKKICEILIFYQDKCYFVHRDLHLPNIIINFNIIDNNYYDLRNFEIKLIDFTYTSIIINNRNNILSEFMNSNYNHFMDINLSNPYLNKDWNTYDLRYFIITLLFARLYDEDLNKLNKNIFINNNLNVEKKNKYLKKVRQLLLNIFQIDKNFRTNYISFKNNKTHMC